MCADTVKAKQSTAEYGRRLCLFLPIKQVDLVELLTLKMVSESRVTWATSVSILVFLGRSVLDLGLRVRQMSDVRQTDIRQYHRLMPPPRGREHSNN